TRGNTPSRCWHDWRHRRRCQRRASADMAVPLQPLRLALLIAWLCWPAERSALAQTGACPQAASDDIAAASPEQVGMQSGRLADAIKSLRENDRDIHALVVLRNCRMVVELYAER